MAKVCEAGMPNFKKYDWDNWLDGQTWELDQGKDFTISLTAFRSVLGQTATRRGLSVNTAFKNGKLFIQATEKS